MSIVLDGTSGVTTPGITDSGNLSVAGTAAITGATTLSTVLGVAQGGTGATSLTANNVLLGNGTSAITSVAPGTNGNVLTSDGTTWNSTAINANSFVTLGTITFTGTSSQFSLGSLTLTSYKQLYITHNLVLGANGTGSISNTTGDQSASNTWTKTGAGNSNSAGWIFINLWNGFLYQGNCIVDTTTITLPIALGTALSAGTVLTGPTAIGTSTTTIYVYVTNVASKSGTMTIYGVK